MLFLLISHKILFAQGLNPSDSLKEVQRKAAVEAQKLMRDKEYQKACLLLEGVINKKRNGDTLSDLLGALYMQSLHAIGRSDSAIQFGKVWAGQDGYSPKPHLELYQIYFSRGDYYNAAHQLELCLMRTPEDVLMTAHAAMLYMHSEELLKGKRLSDRAMESAMKPKEKAAALSSKAMHLMKNKEYELAIHTCKEAIGEDLTYPEPYYLLGVSYSRLGLTDLVCPALINAMDRNAGPWCRDFYETKCEGR